MIDKRTPAGLSNSSAPETLDEDTLAHVIGGARVPSHVPEFTNPTVGDPGRTLQAVRRRMDAGRGVWKAPAGVEAD